MHENRARILIHSIYICVYVCVCVWLWLQNQIRYNEIKLKKKEMRHLRSMSIMEPINPCGKYLVKEIVHLFNCVFFAANFNPYGHSKVSKNKIITTNAIEWVVIWGTCIMKLRAYATYISTVGIGKLFFPFTIREQTHVSGNQRRKTKT